MVHVSQLMSSIEPSPTLAAAARAGELKAQGRDIVSFTVGEPDFDTPEHVKDGARKALEKGYTKYTPSIGIPALRQAIIEKTKRDINVDYSLGQVIVTNGGKQALAAGFAAVLNPGDEVIIPAPYWTSYPDMVKMSNGRPVIAQTKPDEGYVLQPEELCRRATSKTRAIVLNAPSNPTGACYSKDQLSAFIEAFRSLENHRDILIISDEVYEYMVYDGFRQLSVATLAPDLKDNILIVNAFSKSYAMTGWRVGFAMGPKPIIDAMNNHQSQFTSNVCSIAQHAAVEAYTDNGEFPRRMMEEFTRRREWACDFIDTIPGLELHTRPQGAFYLFVCLDGLVGKKAGDITIKSGTEFSALLLEKYDVATVSGDAFGYPNAFRISFALSMERLQTGLERIKKAVESLS